jgi:hypothetical protein
MTPYLQTFDDRPCESIGVVPNLPIQLGDKIVLVDVAIFITPIDFNLLLRCNYVYATKVMAYFLYHVMNFPHEGCIITIDQLTCCSSQLHVTQDNVSPLVAHSQSIPTVWLDHDLNHKFLM